MRILTLVPATCLALLATSALAQQPAPQPSPQPGPAEPAPQQGAAPTPTESPWGMERHLPMGMHHPGMDLAPTLHLRYGDLVLDLPCSARDDTAACANVALGIVDHLRQGDWSGARYGLRRDRGDYGGGDRSGYDRGDRGGYDRGRSDRGDGNDDTGSSNDQ